MATEKQNAANRENATHCTGPNTEGGKAASSQNAIKSGLYADREVLPFEEQSEYDELKAEFYAHFQPTVPEERSLVNMMFRSEWLYRRYMMVECGIWTREFKVTTHGSIGTAYGHHSNELDRVGRRQSRVQRDYQNALKQFTDLRAKRAKESGGKEAATKENQPSRPVPATQQPPEESEKPELNPKLVSFRQSIPATPETASESIHAPTPSTPKQEETPPVAA